MRFFCKCVLAIILIMLIAAGGFYTNSVMAKKEIVPRDMSKIQQIPAFCYHDVVEDNDTKTLEKDPYAVTVSRLEQHFKMFKENGFTPISMQQYEDYLNGKGQLPEKPVLLSFDDGRASMYTRIYPLLKKYNYPAVFAIILSYVDTVPPTDIGPVVTWDQLKEMENSGLVTVASHTYNLHNFIVSNAYGDRNQNAGTIWWTENNVYESEADFKKRIDNDLQMGQKVFTEHMGHSIDILVWPFGMYNAYDAERASQLGYKYQLMLNDDIKIDNPNYLSRFIVFGNPSAKEILKLSNHEVEKYPILAAQLDIDMIYDEMPQQFERNIDLTVGKLQGQNVNTVFLQAFSDTDGDGNVDEVYFHTDKMPVKADVFNHVVNRLKAGGMQVYAWVPLLSYSWMTKNQNDVITAYNPKEAGWYKRATPFNPNLQEKVNGLIHDLVLYAPVDGILFQDDLYMNDFEDFSPWAQKAFYDKFGKTLTPQLLQEDEDIRQQWTKLKGETLNKLTLEAINTAKYYRPEIQTARNIYTALISEPESEEWFAQNYDEFLELYDYVVIMLYPEMEKVDDPHDWIEDMVCKALKNPKGRQKAVFKLQGYDWDNNVWISDKEQYNRVKIIKEENGLHVAQYPVNVYGD